MDLSFKGNRDVTVRFGPESSEQRERVHKSLGYNCEDSIRDITTVEGGDVLQVRLALGTNVHTAQLLAEYALRPVKSIAAKDDILSDIQGIVMDDGLPFVFSSMDPLHGD
ncbi:MAG: hypothetical protein M3Q14_01745 [bacterium]|nr:hypothetical protein [bacterium]